MIRRATTDADLAAAFRVRTEVFVDEQGVPADLELDDRDRAPGTDHVVVEVDGVVVATGRLVEEPAGFAGTDTALGHVGHLGRIAVSRPARGRRLGQDVVRALEDRSRERGLRVAYLASQTHAVPFYERLGYAAHGEEFDDAGLPHRHMTRRLDP